MTQHAFVAGWPIEHSRSPLLHGYWLDQLGIDGSYEKLAVEPEEFEAFLRNLGVSKYVGGNITVPHKEAAFNIVKKRDEIAEALGAVNTVWLEDGQLVGSNTDAYGFAANLDEKAPNWRSGKTAVVLGAGGAARAVLWSIAQAGYEAVHIVNRTTSKAELLAQKFGPQFHAHSWNKAEELLQPCDLLVNTTTLGMNSREKFPLDMTNLSDSAIVTDIVYTPLVTPLLQLASARGLVTVDGLGMLLHQAVPGFERWFGQRPQVTEGLRNHLLASLQQESG